MKIGIVQAYNNDIASYAKKGELINSYYAVKHEYYYLSWDYNLVPPNLSVYYNKIVAMYRALKSDYNFDWILYLDSDAIITNYDISIESIIQRHNDKEIIMAQDDLGANNGVVLIKNTPAMAELLQQVYSDNKFYGDSTPEQTALLAYLGLFYQDKIGWETMQFFNAYAVKYPSMNSNENLWNQDSFILHLQRMTNEKREEIFGQFLQKMKIYNYTI